MQKPQKPKLPTESQNSQSKKSKPPLPRQEEPMESASASGDGASSLGSQTVPFEQAKSAKLTWDEISPQVDNWGPTEFKTFSKTEQVGEMPKPEVNLFVPSKAVPVISIYSPIAAETTKAYNRGLASGLTSTNLKANKPDLKRISELQKIVKANQPTGAYKDFSESEDIGDALKVFAKNPVEVLTSLTAESLSAQAGAIGSASPEAAVSGAAVGSAVPILGTATGALSGAAGSISLALEASSFFTERLQKDGYDITDEESLKKAFEDETYIRELINEGEKRGLPVAAFDALSMGIAGKLGGKTIAKKLIREVPTQSALGGAGEASKQIISEGGITDEVAILAEVLGEIGGGAPEIATGIITNNPELVKRPSTNRQDKMSKLNKAESEIDNDIEKAPTWAKEELEAKRNEIIEEKNKEIIAQAEEYAAFSEEDKAAIGGINERLDEIEALSEQDLSDDTKQILANEAKNLIEQKENIENKYTEQTPQTEEVVDSEQEVVEEEQVTEKQQDTDAVQIEETGEVDVQEQASTSQEMEGEVREQEQVQEEVEPSKERVDNIVKDIVEKTKKRNVGEDTNPQILQENAVSFLQGSKFYEQATDIERENAVREINQELGIKIKRPPSVKRILGEPSPKKVEMTDKALVKQRIQDMAKAARDGYRQRATEVKEFGKQIKDVLKEVPKGVLSSAQASQLAKAATGVQTPYQMRSFLNTAEKVLSDAEFAQQLSDAYKTRAKINIASSAPSNIKRAYDRFKKINPSRVDNLETYERIAEGLLAYKGTPKRKAGEERVEVTEKEGMLPISEINDYIDKQNSLKENDLKRSLLEDNRELVEAGVLDEELTLDEVEMILDAINSDEPSPVFDGDDGARKREGFVRVIASYQNILGSITQSNLNKWDSNAKEALENINVDELSDKLLAMLYTMLNNAIVNNAYNGTQIITSKYNIQKIVPELLTNRSNASREIGDISAGVSNVQSLFRAITGRSSFASSFQNKTGLFSIFKGKSNTEVLEGKAADKVMEITKGDFNTVEKNTFMFFYSTLLTGGQENFSYYKSMIKDMLNIDVKSKDKDTRKDAEIALSVFQERIEPAKSIKQIKITAREQQLVDFFENLFAGIKDDFRSVSENVYNIEFEDYPQKYIPLLWRRRKKLDQQEIGQSFFYQQKPSPKKDGSLNKRTFKVDPKTQTIEYNFINAVISKYGQQLMDIKTAEGIYDFNAFLDHPSAVELMGGENNYNVIRGRIKKYVDGYREYSSKTAPQKAIIEIFNYLTRIGARVKLGGVSQLFKQSIPVIARAFTVLGLPNANLGNKAIKVFFTNSEQVNNLFEKYPISQRGFLKQEFKNIDRKIPKTTRERRKSQLRKLGQLTDDAIEKLAMQPLEFADVTTAKTTWLMFYMQHLKVNQGIDVDNIPLEEVLKPNDEAAAYAEQMVAETQVPSDVDQNGLYLLPSNDIAAIGRRVLFPFVTFRANQAYSLLNSMYGLKDKKERAKSAKELLGVSAENAIFSAISYGYYLSTVLAATTIASFTGIDFEEDDEEEKSKKFRKWLLQSLGSTVANLNPLYGINGGLDAIQIDLLNKFYFYAILDDEEKEKYVNTKELRRAKSEKDIKLVMEKGYNNWTKKGVTPLFDFSKTKREAWYDGAGQAGFAFGVVDQLNETINMSDEETYEYINQWNSVTEKEFTDGEKELLMVSAVMQASNFFLPKEVADVGRRLKSKVQYKDKNKKKGGGTTWSGVNEFKPSN